MTRAGKERDEPHERRAAAVMPGSATCAGETRRVILAAAPPTAAAAADEDAPAAAKLAIFCSCCGACGECEEAASLCSCSGRYSAAKDRRRQLMCRVQPRRPDVLPARDARAWVSVQCLYRVSRFDGCERTSGLACDLWFGRIFYVFVTKENHGFRPATSCGTSTVLVLVWDTDSSTVLCSSTCYIKSK